MPCRCVTIFFGALCGIGYSEGTVAVTGSGSSIHKHSFGTSDQPQRFTPELEDKLREMKKLENEWAAKRRTANDVSDGIGLLRVLILIEPFLHDHRAHG
jgi:hypothetical protein